MIAVISKLNNVSSHNFSRSIQACSENSENPKPSSTKCHLNHEPYPCHVERGDSGPEINCRIIGTETLLARSQDLLRLYLPACLRAAYELLGSHPFRKLDILILPRCYSGLGLASPSLVIFSHKLLTLRFDLCLTKRILDLYHILDHKSWLKKICFKLLITNPVNFQRFACFHESNESLVL